MKYFLSIIFVALIIQSAHAQIVITEDDMPVHGDILSYTNAAITGTNINPGDSGANMVWNYNLVANSQGADAYKLASEVSSSFANSISWSAIGYKIADSIPGLSTLLNAVATLPVSINITNIYTYFQRISTPRPAYMASALSYDLKSIITIPTATNYSDPDVWYFFPLTYGSGTDSTHYRVHLSLMSAAGIEQVGYRKTRVDGWGTITTPYFTTPVECIRVRSEIHEIDSVDFSGNTFGFPRDMVEYKWLVNGEHYPALWVTYTVVGGTETITTVRYRDTLTGATGLVSATPTAREITTFPNPSADGQVMVNIPADWKAFRVEVFDINAKTVAVINNERHVDLSSCAAGRYFIRVTSGSNVGYATVVRN